jgi:hypothetical protein
MYEQPRKLCRVAALWVFVTGCSAREPVLPESQKVPDLHQALTEELDAFGSIRFRSYNGEFGGTDADVDIVLFADGRAEVTAYGQGGPEKYIGQYAANSELILTLDKDQFVFVQGNRQFARSLQPDYWSEKSLSLYHDGASLLVAPAYGSGRDERDPFWRFRLILP